MLSELRPTVQMPLLTGAAILPSALFAGWLWAMPAATTPSAIDTRCRHADRAAVALMQPMLEAFDPRRARGLERVMTTLTSARSHCVYGWVTTALEHYAAIQAQLADLTEDQPQGARP